MCGRTTQPVSTSVVCVLAWWGKLSPSAPRPLNTERLATITRLHRVYWAVLRQVISGEGLRISDVRPPTSFWTLGCVSAAWLCQLHVAVLRR